MSIMSYTGGTVLAMAGDGCVCIATDLRLGEQMTTIATDVKKVVQQLFFHLLFFNFRFIKLVIVFMLVFVDFTLMLSPLRIKFCIVKACMNFVKIVK